MATYAGAAKGPAPPPAGYKRILDDFENDEMYVKYKNKRLRVVYEDDLPPVLLRTRKPRTFMIMTDEVEEKAWRNPYGTAFEGHLRNGADGALRPDAYISVSNNTGLGNMVEDELWANRNAGNMIHKLCERIDWLNEKFGWLRQRAIDADAQAEKLRHEITRLKTGGNNSKEGDKYLDFFRHVRYRTMIQFAHNRGYMDKNAPFQDWGGPDRLFNRLRLLSNMMHGGDLRSDVALADSDYLQQYQNEPPIKFYLPMFEKIYMTPIGLARWLSGYSPLSQDILVWRAWFNSECLLTKSIKLPSQCSGQTLRSPDLDKFDRSLRLRNRLNSECIF